MPEPHAALANDRTEMDLLSLHTRGGRITFRDLLLR